jgi:hypothetical protein
MTLMIVHDFCNSCVLHFCQTSPAVLNRSNMVGLLYIHDPKCGPQQHAAEAQQLMAAFDQQYPMAVFKLKDKGGVQGDLLTINDSGSSGGSNGGGGSGGGARSAGPDALAGELALAGGGTEAAATAAAGEAGAGCRLLTFQEYLEQQDQQGASKQQKQQQEQEQHACALSALQQTFSTP